MNEIVHLEIGPPAPVQVCQLAVEFTAVLDLYREAKPKRVLEIGTASGGTLYHWLTNATPGTTVVSVDFVEPEYALDRGMCQSWAPEGVQCELIAGNSHNPETFDAVEAFGPFHWLFIDGSHVYEDALMDWDDYRCLCWDGAYVFLHDIALQRSYPDGTEAGVGRLWREIQAEGYWTREIRAHPNLDAYGIGCVRLPE